MHNESLFNQSQPDPDQETFHFDIKLKGEILTILFQSDDDQYKIARIIDHKHCEHIIVGTLPGICEGQELEVKGNWENHQKFGKRLKVTEFSEILPSTEQGIIRYLSSGIIPGIGPKLAERIVGKFDLETLEILDNASSRLSEVKGISKKRAKEIREIWTTKTHRRDSFIFLHGLGISQAYGNRIFKKFGDKATQIIQDNPYRLANEVKGIGFKMADEVAARLNIAVDNPFRLASGVVYVLNQLTDRNGHVCFPRKELVEQAAEILNVSTELAEEGVKRGFQDGALVEYRGKRVSGNELIYSKYLYEIEKSLADHIKIKICNLKFNTVPTSEIKTPHGSVLNSDQKSAVKNAFQFPISIITGGPGVGKTTVTREIVALATVQKLEIQLAAPTGRAAKKLTESSGHSASTIHRLLKWDPHKQLFSYNADNPLKADLIIIDEISMLDIVLAYHLFNAVLPETNLVLVGDKDQLPSIGPGSFLHDLIQSNQVNVTYLNQIYRQSEGSYIIANAHKVNSGKMPEFKKQSDQLTDFYWIDQDDQNKVVELIGTMVNERIPKRFNLSPITDIQVLTPMNQGLCGTKNLNLYLQKSLNPKVNSNSSELHFGESSFFDGDRVMQISNNYDLNVFNGDLGIIQKIDPQNKTFHIVYDTGVVTYSFDDADQLRLAYATTIHKSQGSEFPAVIIPVISQHYIMLQRNLIYTAMTRAQKLLILIGSKKALAIAVNNHRLKPRFTRLKDRIVSGF